MENDTNEEDYTDGFVFVQNAEYTNPINPSEPITIDNIIRNMATHQLRPIDDVWCNKIHNKLNNVGIYNISTLMEKINDINRLLTIHGQSKLHQSTIDGLFFHAEGRRYIPSLPEIMKLLERTAEAIGGSSSSTWCHIATYKLNVIGIHNITSLMDGINNNDINTRLNVYGLP